MPSDRIALSRVEAKENHHLRHYSSDLVISLDQYGRICGLKPFVRRYQLQTVQLDECMKNVYTLLLLNKLTYWLRFFVIIGHS